MRLVRAARAGRDGAVFVFVCEAEVTEHLHVFLDRRAGRREHVARDGRRRAGLERRRAVLRQELAAGGEADVRRWIDKAEERDRAQDVIGGQLRSAFHLRARNRHQRVDGDGLDAELLQRDRHVKTIFPSIAHADDAAGADAEAFFLRHLDCFNAVIVRVARADLGEEAAARLDVVMIARDRSEERRVGKECRSRWSPYH